MHFKGSVGLLVWLVWALGACLGGAGPGADPAEGLDGGSQLADAATEAQNPTRDRADARNDLFETSRDRADATNDLFETSRDRADARNDLFETSREVTDAANDLFETIREVADAANDLFETSREVTDAANDLFETIREVTDAANDLFETSREVADAGPDLCETTRDFCDAAPGPADLAPDGAAAPCPPGMVPVDAAFCIDAYEAFLEERDADGTWRAASPYLTVGTRIVRAAVAPGAVPQGYLSGSEAAAACERADKRLCTSAEWLRACQGPAGHTYPYGPDYRAGACNDDYPGGHPVVDFFGTAEGVWDGAHMNDPGINQQPNTVAPAGAFAACLASCGAFDLHGNLHEWVADADGTFRGGFYADAAVNGPGCRYVTTAHTVDYHDYSTGFRCCRSRP